jgi:hypothetical protein
MVSECHAQVIEVPENWPKSAQEGHTEHHVIAVEGDHEAIDNKLRLATNTDGNVTG